MDLFVSKLGDDSDGRGWATAWRTIQQALAAVPDGGGHRIIIRPDTYAEANLWPAHPGQPGAYCRLVGDGDGSLGSGATGWVVIDSGAPEVIVRTDLGRRGAFQLLDGEPSAEYGLKSVDWWVTWRCDPYFSGAAWDRWSFHHLYCTGSELGVGWDMTRAAGCEFSAVVEDCVGIGRFAGAAAIAHVPRPGEPVIFRDSWFLNLDWWGDSGAAYVRGESETRPELPHAVFENCALVGPNNALKSAWPGVDDKHTRVALTDCRLIVLNFSQPRGTPSTGIIRCDSAQGRQLHVDLSDCTLMGYQVFGCRAGEIGYTTRGRVAAYVEYEQPVPDGMERLRYWPVELFGTALSPPVKPSAAGCG